MRKSLGERADVAVVGGGVAGLAAARELARRGLSVAVIEDNRAGSASRAAADGLPLYVNGGNEFVCHSC